MIKYYLHFVHLEWQTVRNPEGSNSWRKKNQKHWWGHFSVMVKVSLVDERVQSDWDCCPSVVRSSTVTESGRSSPSSRLSEITSHRSGEQEDGKAGSAEGSESPSETAWMALVPVETFSRSPAGNVDSDSGSSTVVTAAHLDVTHSACFSSVSFGFWTGADVKTYTWTFEGCPTKSCLYEGKGAALSTHISDVHVASTHF